MHKIPEKVFSHIPGPVTGLAREKRIAEGTAGPIQPGYEVTGMQSTISGSPPHESSANRNHEGTATYSSAPVVLRPAYMEGQAMTAGGIHEAAAARDYKRLDVPERTACFVCGRKDTRYVGEAHPGAEEPAEGRADRPEDMQALLPGCGRPRAFIGTSAARGDRHVGHGTGERIDRPVLGPGAGGVAGQAERGEVVRGVPGEVRLAGLIFR